MKHEKQALILFGVLAILIIGILVLLIRNSEGGTENFVYNDYAIQEIREGNYVGYRTSVFIDGRGPYFMNTRYSPRDLEDITVEEKLRSHIDNKTVLFIHVKDLNESFTGQTSVAGLELDGLIERFYSIPVKFEDNLMDCSDANETTLVYEFRLSNENKISFDGGCIIAEGKTQEDFVRLADRTIFHLLGIMED